MSGFRHTDEEIWGAENVRIDTYISLKAPKMSGRRHIHLGGFSGVLARVIPLTYKWPWAMRY
jgi:hypothetical protein